MSKKTMPLPERDPAAEAAAADEEALAELTAQLECPDDGDATSGQSGLRIATSPDAVPSTDKEKNPAIAGLREALGNMAKVMVGNLKTRIKKDDLTAEEATALVRRTTHMLAHEIAHSDLSLLGFNAHSVLFDRLKIEVDPLPTRPTNLGKTRCVNAIQTGLGRRGDPSGPFFEKLFCEGVAVIEEGALTDTILDTQKVFQRLRQFGEPEELTILQQCLVEMVNIAQYLPVEQQSRFWEMLPRSYGVDAFNRGMVSQKEWLSEQASQMDAIIREENHHLRRAKLRLLREMYQHEDLVAGRIKVKERGEWHDRLFSSYLMEVFSGIMKDSIERGDSIFMSDSRRFIELLAEYGASTAWMRFRGAAGGLFKAVDKSDFIYKGWEFLLNSYGGSDLRAIMPDSASLEAAITESYE